ncbi:MAG: GWxTD domain-containing protein [Acidobacteria bacterium]|nr:GWxTD domain-containing protein [Acidobacteriota bacterium]
MKSLVCSAVLAACVFVSGQPLKLQGSDSFLDLVAPLITQHEKDMYQGLKQYSDKDYFEAIFWFKRDPYPEQPGNVYKTEYFQRRDQASRFDEGSVAGTKTARGQIFLLLGEPDEVEQNRLTAAGEVSGYEEIWIYREPDVRFRFILGISERTYRLDASADHEEKMEQLRMSQIRDRAESYRLQPFRISIPNIGATKDIENITIEDSYDLDLTLSYDFFKGDLNKTRVLVGITLHDTSGKGAEFNLTAFDPYENKVVDFKQKVNAVNDQYENFFIMLEPDQYQMVLRVMDSDGRQSVVRRWLDVPRLGQAGTASSLLLADQLKDIPLEGFFQPRLLVFDNLHLPIRNAFRRPPSSVYVMQVFYGVAQPTVRFRASGQNLNARLQTMQQSDDQMKWVHAVDLPRGVSCSDIEVLWEHGGKTSVYRSGVWQGNTGSDNRDPRFEWRLPQSTDAVSLHTVAIQPQRSDVSRMTLLLNGVPKFERHEAPWRIDLDDDFLSISGRNTLSVEIEDGLGISRSSLKLNPLRADEQIKTRAMHVTFNAYDRNLNFVTDLDLGGLSVTVDGEAWEPMDVFKLEEPITYCFLVDSSYSMRESFKGNIKALKHFINTIRPEDQGFIVAFSDNYDQYNLPTSSKGILHAVADSVPIQRPNPSDGDKIYEENTTYLYDACAAAIHALLQYPGRKVIVLVSDGISLDGMIPKNGMLSYARENEVVIYSLWVDNNPQVSDDETAFITKDMGRGERFARAIGLTRFFADKDARRQTIGTKIRQSSIHEGVIKMLSEESGGFHYRVFKSDRTLIQEYASDIQNAIQTQFGMILNLPISDEMQHIEIVAKDDGVAIRTKSEVKVRKTNPLGD